MSQPSDKEIEDAYEELGSVVKVAETFHVSRKTMERWMDSIPLRRERGWKRGRKKTEHHFSAFVKWVKEHPKHPLPPSVREMVALTGVSKDSIKSYLYRRRKTIKGKVMQLLPLSQFKGGLIDTASGVFFPFRYFEKESIHVENFSFLILIKAKIKGTEIYKNFSVSYDSLRKIISQEKMDHTESK